MAITGTDTTQQNMGHTVDTLTATTVAATNITATGTLTLGGVAVGAPFRVRINANVAAAGSSVTDAAQLLEGGTVVTGANGTLGVKLPATPTAGVIVLVKGTTAGVLKVYPDAAATINAIGSNAAISLTTGAMPCMFVAWSPTQWYTFPLVAS
jgi:hypothetical protein